jgi:hypothetical protein
LGLTIYKIHFALTFEKLKTLCTLKLINGKIDGEDAQAHNSGFCNIGAEAIPISSGSLLGFGSGRSFSIGLFVLIFIFGFSIGQRFRAEEFQIPQHRKALSLCEIFSATFFYNF